MTDSTGNMVQRQNSERPGAIYNMELTDEAFVEDDSDMDDNAALHESGFF